MEDILVLEYTGTVEIPHHVISSIIVKFKNIQRRLVPGDSIFAFSVAGQVSNIILNKSPAEPILAASHEHGTVTICGTVGRGTYKPGIVWPC